MRALQRRVRSSSRQEVGEEEEEEEVPTFEGDEDSGRGQRLVAHRDVAGGHAAQRQEAVQRPQSVQLHGCHTSSPSAGGFDLGKIITKQKQKEKGVCGDKGTEMRRQLNLTHRHGDRGSLWVTRLASRRAQQQAELHMCTCRRSRSDERRVKEPNPLARCARFHLVKIIFVCERQTDGRIAVTQ